jgi:putative nucleotidyltransferase with HDIG domain
MVYTFSLHHLDLVKVTAKENLLAMLRQHDYQMYVYSIRTAQISIAICRELGMSEKEIEMHYLCGLYHDIGKLGMSFDFLNYPGTYTDEMFSEMRKHPLAGAALLEYVKADAVIVENCRHHHTNFDGSGYPGGLSKEEIPLQARITRISDSIDAFLSKRAYKQGGSVYAVIDDLMRFAGTHYDPKLLAVFKRVHQKVVSLCQNNGISMLSQDDYMYYLCELYVDSKYQLYAR